MGVNCSTQLFPNAIARVNGEETNPQGDHPTTTNSLPPLPAVDSPHSSEDNELSTATCEFTTIVNVATVGHFNHHDAARKHSSTVLSDPLNLTSRDDDHDDAADQSLMRCERERGSTKGESVVGHRSSGSSTSSSSLRPPPEITKTRSGANSHLNDLSLDSERSFDWNSSVSGGSTNVSTQQQQQQRQHLINALPQHMNRSDHPLSGSTSDQDRLQDYKRKYCAPCAPTSGGGLPTFGSPSLLSPTTAGDTPVERMPLPTMSMGDNLPHDQPLATMSIVSGGGGGSSMYPVSGSEGDPIGDVLNELSPVGHSTNHTSYTSRWSFFSGNSPRPSLLEGN